MTHVLIAGGGIAGLTMALTCHEVGVPATVYESVAELRPLGLGINLQPAAVRELHDLGLASELADIGTPTSDLVLARHDGTQVWSEPRGVMAGYRWPQYSVHRGELQMMLHRAVLDRLGPDAVVHGRRVTHYEHGPDIVFVDVAGTDGLTDRVEGSVLLACDGLHSAVRSQMFPGEGGPRWGGSVLWRGAAPAAAMRAGESFVIIGDATQRFVVFPISAPDPATGEQMQNWIAEHHFDPLRGWRRGDWNTLVDDTEFIDDFAGWSFEGLDVADLIGRTDRIFEYPMVDRDPAEHWVHGSVALLGDAAHPMYPVGSNGASQAIVDARVVGAAFVEHGVGKAALGAYEAELLGPRSSLVLHNRAAGPASALDVIVEGAARVFDDIDHVTPDVLDRFAVHYRTESRRFISELNDSPSTIPHGARVRSN